MEPEKVHRGVDPGSLIAEALTKAGVLDTGSARAYGSLFSRFMRQQRRGLQLDWGKATPPSKDMVVDYSSLEPCPEKETLHQELLNKIAIVKLNGGLGSGMGCKVRLATATSTPPSGLDVSHFYRAPRAPFM